MKKIKIVFIGGLTNGAIVCDYLRKNKFVELALIITYPDDALYPRAIRFEDTDNTIKAHQANAFYDKIKAVEPDYIFVAGWSELLSENLINLPTNGVVGFHPSKLPFDRGRSVLAWQIEEGYTETALTMFFYSTHPDGGDIIAQEKIRIEKNDYISDVLDKVDKATLNLMTAYFPLLRKGELIPTKQNLSEGSFRRLRNETDSMIHWDTNSCCIFNKIRAISHPYPGAIAFINNEKYKIWRSEVVDEFPCAGNQLTSGQQVAMLYDDSLIIKTRDSFLRITEYEKI